MSENELFSVACSLISCVIMLYTCRRKLQLSALLPVVCECRF